MNERSAVTFSADSDGIGWIVFDLPGSRANIFTPVTQAALESAIDDARRSGVRALVLMSGKERIFIAGADLKLLGDLPDAGTATAFARRGQLIFQQIADFPVPVVCAIHGACAGGGFELALACHWRIASDAPETRIGLPETGIGTIPGWGGSVRLPRLIGVKPALDHILKAQLIGAGAALKLGLVQEVVSAADLKARAQAAALKLAREGVPAANAPAPPNPAVYQEFRDAVLARTHGQQPALITAIDAVEQTVALPVAEALVIEARLFGEVTAEETCRSLVRVFLLRDAAKKRSLAGWFDDNPNQTASPSAAQAAAVSIRRVGVVGAGVMGSGIAHWLATQGFEVVLRDVEARFIERGMSVVRGLFDEAVKRGQSSAGAAAAGLQRIATTTGWEGFSNCDLVIEAIVEKAAVKQALFSELAAIVPRDALLASNTSALPIEEIAGHVINPGRTLGIHFFNPVSRMALVELVLAAQTTRSSAERALGLIKALGKSPVICRSSPGFLVTRVLFFYLNEAVRFWERGVPASVIDAALRDFGWPMGPMRLIDEVGVDVTDFIFGEMEHYFPQRFRRSRACRQMLANGLQGRKNGASRGFYRYEGRQETVNDDETRQFVESEDGPCAESEICDRLMRVMAEEAQRCLDEGIVKSADDIDFALLTGAGFPAFRGGLMRWARSRSALR